MILFAKVLYCTSNSIQQASIVERPLPLFTRAATGGDSLSELLRPLSVLRRPRKPQDREERQDGPGRGDQEESQVVANL